ncbi:uncharacterized protein LOC124440879 [Xenia sp. Carnegie-2017]|uniref:uncharacterized protein LOC124440879 n=1 Tax=Xenia sp. Carnegie-2017 TaxID=2897299 RepID=UPI001F036508|nr:uncharacterized protein LOC124440879 [Xenia sp. Carnegie-2017]XP_046847267.1 uncharacterized protein LOC124440879 [Xenia sp. Carnegie-2017]
MNQEEGLKALKTSIKAIEEVIMNKKGTFVLQQAINPISPPTYVVTSTTMNREEGLKALETSIKAIEEVIMNTKGTNVLQQAESRQIFGSWSMVIIGISGKNYVRGLVPTQRRDSSHFFLDRTPSIEAPQFVDI